MTKVEVAAYVSAICLIVGSLTGFEVGTEVQGAVVTLILGGITAYGIYKNNRKPKDPQ